jgi:Zn-dependent metalloprotease
MKKSLHATRKGIAVMVVMIILAISSDSNGQDAQSRQELFGSQAEQIVPGASKVTIRPGTDFPAQVRMKPGNQISIADFESFLRNNFKFNNEFEFVQVKSQENNSGQSVLAFQVLYRGIQIEHGIIIAHTRNGLVERFGGFAGYPESAPVSPNISETMALETAKNSTGARQFLWEVPEQENFLKKRLQNDKATYYPKGELIYVLENSTTGTPSIYRLAWQFDIRDAESKLARRIFVDASSGKVIKSYSLVHDCDAGSVATTWHGTQSISTDYIAGDDNYILLDDCNAASIHTILEAGNAEITDANNSWTETGVTDYATTHFYARVTMDYFSTVHSRDSYDDADGDLLLRHVAGWSNASYIGGGTLRIGMNTGNQGEFYNTLDVVSHEFTHAVTDNNGLGGLTYQGESGALNEAFSDILGETAEMWYENGAYTIDWLHREDYVGGANRSFWNPNDGGQPDTYLGTNWAPTGAGDPDEGGVHTNSGVMNYWFYLLCVGADGTNDNGDDFSVDPISVVDVRDLVYRMLTEEMTSNANYADARTAALNVAIDMFGDCSYEVKQVTNAWYAVGVGDPYVEATLESPEFAGGYNISCFGSADGSVDLSYIGTGPFTVVWDDSPETGNRAGLGAGTYTVTVTDATGCSDTKSITLTEPPLLVGSAEVTSDYNGYAVSCNGGSDGVATASGSGGVAPYSYVWDASAGSQVTAEATGLSAGTYSVTITDANGCTDVAEVTLDEPPALTIEAGDNQTVYFGYPPMACATLSYSGAGGGVPPYSFEWSTAESTQDIEVCPEVSTMYYVTITDANGCTATDSVIVCAIDVRCGKKLDKVELCHIPPDNPGNPETICVAVISVAEHLAHGDMLAACGTDHSCTDLLPKSAPVTQVFEPAMKLEASPNPFTEQTRLSFTVEREGQASLKLIDSYGKVVSTLFDGAVNADVKYDLDVNGRLYGSGLYYGKLQHSDGSSEVIKLIVR